MTPAILQKYFRITSDQVIGNLSDNTYQFINFWNIYNYQEVKTMQNQIQPPLKKRILNKLQHQRKKQNKNQER